MNDLKKLLENAGVSVVNEMTEPKGTVVGGEELDKLSKGYQFEIYSSGNIAVYEQISHIGEPGQPGYKDMGNKWYRTAVFKDFDNMLETMGEM